MKGMGSTAIARLYAEYSGLWFGECSERVAARMGEIERLVDAVEPATLAEAKMQRAIVVAASGTLDAGRLLAQPAA